MSHLDVYLLRNAARYIAIQRVNRVDKTHSYPLKILYLFNQETGKVKA